jgi:hypothetical protein
MRRDVFRFANFQDQTSSIVLKFLDSVQKELWAAIEKRIAIINT